MYAVDVDDCPWPTAPVRAAGPLTGWIRPFSDGDPAPQESFRMAGADTPQWAVMPGEQQYASVLRSSMAIIGVAGSEEFSVGCIQGRVLSVISGGV